MNRLTSEHFGTTMVNQLTLLFISVLHLNIFYFAHQHSYGDEPMAVKWRKHTINDRSPFEAAGVADFNGDSKLDVFCGDSWYAAPNWTQHKVRYVFTDLERGTISS
jgi:hypothetical protein